MKSKIMIISALSLGILAMLAGCGETANPAGTGQPATSNNPAQSASSGQPAVQTPVPPVSNAPATSAAEPAKVDSSAYNGAMQLKDASFCDKIKDEAYKKTCKADLADQLVGTEALAKLDPSLCDKLSTKDKQDSCKIDVEVGIQQKQQATEKQDSINKDHGLLETVVKDGDYTKCSQISDANFRSSCEYNILANKAVVEKNVKLCDNISSAGFKDLCINNYASAKP